MENNDLDFEMIRRNRAIRRHMAESSHYCFFHLYMSRYVQYPTAEFHKELYKITEDESVRHAVVVAFRGSGKSTIMTVSYPIWAILGKQQKKFVVILSQTQNQARTHLTNIKREFESNELLRKDYGPLEAESDEWGTSALMLPKFNARIIAASTEQSIRGIRHGAYRPDLIIADDVEDMQSVKTREGRNKTYDWFSGEILPLGDQSTKIITIGNLLHEDSLLMRLREKIEAKTMTGVFKKFPLISKNQCLWPGKYPDAKALREQERMVGNPIAWQREYLLNIIPDEDQVIDPCWIQYYEELPRQDREHEYLNTFICVDLAISEKASADYTAIIVVHVYGYETKDRRYYVDKCFVNKHMTFQQTLETVQGIYGGFNTHSNQNAMLLVEKVAYQDAAIQVFEHNGLNVKGVGIKSDKRSRLSTASMLFEQGRVFFPTDKSCNAILQQLVGFGVEKHDDLMDAVTMGLNYVNTKVVRTISMMIARRNGHNTTFYNMEYRD